MGSKMSVKTRRIVIGEGTPKICVPIVAKDNEDACIQAQNIIKYEPDIIEFRADYFVEWKNENEMLHTLNSIREVIGDTVLLFTFRTDNEGGNAHIEAADYIELCKYVCESGLTDLIDVEAFYGDNVFEKVIEIAHNNDIYVVASNHDFDKTPDSDEILRRLAYMDEKGADILKIAVMPENRVDVLTLMTSVVKYTDENDKPVIAMSMGGQGLVSRFAGELFGSAVTFASVGRASAPGQIPIDEVRKVLGIIHTYG